MQAHADHNNVAIAVSVRRSADREQCNHRSIVRQAIERARANPAKNFKVILKDGRVYKNTP
jgi:hypothetical protein